ncbi:MAG TPA: exodeoxyribonuclease V subunit alpha [Solirubrobacteraceae bacterium]|jgi:exodeoxyribonuclease V alpha subunit|nr:exodeoxyribonuclease V subunit alpha [Solirubrobacteraceae bacterium]
MTSLRERDPHDVRLARIAPEPLRAFNEAGVLSSADVQVARRLAALGDVDDPAVLLALALAVRAPRLGHVLVDLATIRGTVAVDTEELIDLAALDWPEPADWVARVAACTLVTDPPHPLRLDGARLYLDRYWREEREVARRLRALAGAAPADVDEAELATGAQRLYPEASDARARAALQAAVRRRLTVIAGGPGTGKTTAVARVVALLVEQARAQEPGVPPPLIALAAPTGKAAARLGEAVNKQATRLDVDPETRAALMATSPRTLHRLLGSRPGSRGRFHYNHLNRLPHDVVIIDETSMVSLTLMARLLEALGDDARLILIGDPDQLSSIEAGAVLGDIAAALADSVIVLDRVHRFGVGIAAVADAVRRGDAEGTVTALRASGGDVTWIAEDSDAIRVDTALAPVREAATAAGRTVIAAARDGDAPAALAVLGEFRMLCAHRRGPHGVSTWMPTVERWLAAEIDAAGGHVRDYPGRPLLITANDYDLNLFNGDTGVVVSAGDSRVLAAFEQRGGVATVRPNQLGAVETVYAMTVHKSQGSQFATAAVLLPPPSSRILTRELLYTAVTRASRHLIVVGTEAAVRAAVARPAARASGLRERLRDVQNADS